jgi:hypothetical protein
MFLVPVETVAELQHLKSGCTKGATSDKKTFLGGAYVVKKR